MKKVWYYTFRTKLQLYNFDLLWNNNCSMEKTMILWGKTMVLWKNYVTIKNYGTLIYYEKNYGTIVNFS